MKKLIASLLFVGFISLNTHAQDRKSELTVGYGIASTSQIVGALSDVLTTGFTGGTTTSTNSKYTGALHAGYKYSLNERISIGPTFVYENKKANALFNNTLSGKFDTNYYTFAAEMKLKYVDKNSFSLYGLAGAGATHFTQKYTSSDNSEIKKDNVTHFNYQITPIGIQFGSSIGLFAELGFGYKGIVSAGLFARF